jgi:hypothetical protein
MARGKKRSSKKAPKRATQQRAKPAKSAAPKKAARSRAPRVPRAEAIGWGDSGPPIAWGQIAKNLRLKPPKPETVARVEKQRRASKKPAPPVTREGLLKLRNEIGWRELSKRLGVPPPSLRRMLSSGKSGGLPKSKRGAKEIAERVQVARMKSPRSREERETQRQISKALREGAFETELYEIAEKMDRLPREIYAWAMGSPPAGVHASTG